MESTDQRSSQPELAYIGIGSNLGDRLANLRLAVAAIDRSPCVDVDALSSVYESPAWGYESPGKFLNLVAAVRCSLAPLKLLIMLQNIELELGRERSPAIRYTDRTIDLDIVAFPGFEQQSQRLTIPHDQAHRRAFVLLPLKEIAPQLRFDGVAVTEWLARLPAEECASTVRTDYQV